MTLSSPPGGSNLRNVDNPIRVFVVNDSAIFVAALGRFLDDELDIVVVGTAAGLPEALAAAEHSQPEVVLIDPEPHDLLVGRAVRELRTTLPQACIIVLTVHVDDAHRSVAMEAGADEFVGKWGIPEDLLSAIRNNVARRSRFGK